MNESLFWITKRSSILDVDWAMHELVDWSAGNKVNSILRGPANRAVEAITTLTAVPLPDPPNLDEFIERAMLPCFQG
jgi:hypothetical protein